MSDTPRIRQTRKLHVPAHSLTVADLQDFISSRDLRRATRVRVNYDRALDQREVDMLTMEIEIVG